MIDMDLLSEGCSLLGTDLSDYQKKQFEDYYTDLTEKNKVMNLTSITEPDEVIIKHYLDSLSIIKAVNFSCVRSVIDIGTGAGFPGIPLKIMFPDIQFVLLDSLKKRISFLGELIDHLRLKNITLLHGRAEDYGRDENYRETFDLCVSRAVANLSSLSEYCLPFVKAGGKFVSYKSGNIEEELTQAERAVSLLKGKIVTAPFRFTLPCSDIERTLIIIEKTGKTPGKYPRKAGTPGKMPL